VLLRRLADTGGGGDRGDFGRASMNSRQPKILMVFNTFWNKYSHMHGVHYKFIMATMPSPWFLALEIFVVSSLNAKSAFSMLYQQFFYPQQHAFTSFEKVWSNEKDGAQYAFSYRPMSNVRDSPPLIQKQRIVLHPCIVHLLMFIVAVVYW
jgi:hypothetical protein